LFFSFPVSICATSTWWNGGPWWTSAEIHAVSRVRNFSVSLLLTIFANGSAQVNQSSLRHMMFYPC